jgi:PAS domain-containing protein
MTYTDIEKLILLFFTQLSLFIGLYFKLKKGSSQRHSAVLSEVKKKLDEVKNHQDVSVQKLNGMLSYLIHSFGRPAWLKVARQTADGIDFRMIEVNQAYAEAFGIARLDYLGKTDLEAGWEHETAAKFKDHDLAVWASGEPMTVVETVNGKPMRFRKIRVQSLDGEKKGIFAYAIDCQEPEQCPLWGKDHECNPVKPA